MTLARTCRVVATLGMLGPLAAGRTGRPAGVGAAGSRGADGVARAVVAASGPEARPVRLTMHRGEAIVLLAPVIERDSVVGAEARSYARRAIALTAVEQVEAWRVSARRTLVGVAAGMLAVAAVAYAVLTAFVAGNV